MTKRKLKYLIMAAVMAVFLLSGTVEAKRGCCSSHGGVDCGAGAQSNGKVICYDGWRGSSCLYSEMVKCGGSSSSTTEYQPSVQTTPVAPIVAPIPPPPSPVVIYVYPSPIPSPEPSPEPSPTPSPIPPSPSPAQSPVSTPSPQVLGEETDSESSGGGLVAAGLLGYVTWRAIKQKWPFHANL